MLFQNTCPNVTFTCLWESGKCLYSYYYYLVDACEIEYTMPRHVHVHVSLSDTSVCILLSHAQYLLQCSQCNSVVFFLWLGRAISRNHITWLYSILGESTDGVNYNLTSIKDSMMHHAMSYGAHYCAKFHNLDQMKPR